ncbi:hypothetical protein F4776DRAFT_625273 [Hypoxylon sp. NC0597]|nr:hypothetical protein F4776DRAFT_625273 [Hypoxylon sp. NC0597]
MCFVGALLPSHQLRKKHKSSNNSTMPANTYPDIPAYYAPSPFNPRVVPEAYPCRCEECDSARSYQQRMNPRSSSSEPESIKGDTAAIPQHGLPRMRNGPNNGAGNPDMESQNRPRRLDSHLPGVTTVPRPEMAYPEVYIYPNTSHHITFPIVDYSSRRRDEKEARWPACYLAISPPCSKPADFEAALCPPGSKLIVVARLSKTKKTAPLSSFKNINELRRDSVQLEVWDEGAAKDVKNGHGSETKAGVGNRSNGAKVGFAKQTKKGMNKA